MTISAPKHSIIDTRRQQMFPNPEPAEIERVRRFGVVRSYGVGEALERVGKVGPGLTIILAGKVDVTQHDASSRREPIVTYGPGAFIGELAQLAGRPALVDAYAPEPVEALIISPDRLRVAKVWLLVRGPDLESSMSRYLVDRIAELAAAAPPASTCQSPHPGLPFRPRTSELDCRLVPSGPCQ
jgi:thioredoxin reductase (NADPH)